MDLRRVIGIVVVAAGVALFVVGLNASDSLLDRMSNFFTGRFTDATVWYMIGGGALAIGGLALAVYGGRGSRV